MSSSHPNLFTLFEDSKNSQNKKNDPYVAPSQQQKKTVPASSDAMTPLMAQYFEIKNAFPDCLLFFRLGDFYELFFDDAVRASDALGITLTKRGKHLGDDIPMAGVPVHASDDYLHRLIAAGYRVAIAEQVEDPAQAKKRGSKSIVKRDVVRIVTPGTVTEDALLDHRSSNYLLSVRADDNSDTCGLAWCDLSTGEIYTSSVGLSRLDGELMRIAPREIVIADAIIPSFDQTLQKSGLSQTLVTKLGLRSFSSATSNQTALNCLGLARFDGLGLEHAIQQEAIVGLMSYLLATQCGLRFSLKPPQVVDARLTLDMDGATRMSLDLFSQRDGERASSRKSSALFDIINHTMTGGGARELARWLNAPSLDVALIRSRQMMVGRLIDMNGLRLELRTLLKGLGDAERALSRIKMSRAGPRDIQVLARLILTGHRIFEILKTHENAFQDVPFYHLCVRDLARAPHVLANTLAQALDDSLPLLTRDGGFIAKGFDPELDQLLSFKNDAQVHLVSLESKYRELTGVKSLKIKHNAVLGPFIEVSPSHRATLDRFVDRGDFFHRQSLQNAIRFGSSELVQLHEKLTRAKDDTLARELAIFDTFCTDILAVQTDISGVCSQIHTLDCYLSLAETAIVYDWVCPLVDDSSEFAVQGGRHPGVEVALRHASVRGAGQDFVANDCLLSPDPHDTHGKIALVTGPNMGGKSTYLRQNALIVILAHMGSFVPALSAHIGLVDRLFSRVGASDDLAQGQSTFMVEMVETARILNRSTERSFVIVDEIGRGTATWDGLSIAWAVLHYLHEKITCRGLFATHFHELHTLSQTLPRVFSLRMDVKEWNGDLVFLYSVVLGAAQKSYGLQVAKLAGVPDEALDQARALLQDLEKTPLMADHPLFECSPAALPSSAQATSDTIPHPLTRILDALKDLDIDALSPRAALDQLYALKRIVDDG